MTTKSVALKPLSRFFSLFVPDVSSENISETQIKAETKIEENELLQMLDRQKRINDLMYVWSFNDQGVVEGSWTNNHTSV